MLCQSKALFVPCFLVFRITDNNRCVNNTEIAMVFANLAVVATDFSDDSGDRSFIYLDGNLGMSKIKTHTQMEQAKINHL